MSKIVIGLLLSTIILLIQRYTRSRRPPLPPGPRGWPLIGSILEMPAVRPWEKYREWCQAYSTPSPRPMCSSMPDLPSMLVFLDSDLVHLHLPMQPTMIVGSAEIAIELFEKRSQTYSDRARYVVLEE